MGILIIHAIFASLIAVKDKKIKKKNMMTAGTELINYTN